MKYDEFDETIMNSFLVEGHKDWRLAKKTEKESIFVRDSRDLGVYTILKVEPSSDGQVFSFRLMHKYGILRDPSQGTRLLNGNYGGVNDGPYYFSVYAQETENGFLFTLFLECWTKVLDYSKEEIEVTLGELMQESILYFSMNLPGVEPLKVQSKK